MEDEIPALEEKVGEVEAAINGIGGDYERLGALSAELEETNALLEEKMMRWLELSEKDG